MDAIEEKYRIIAAHESRFAFVLGSRIIPRPKLSVWMILIPIIFVYYFYRFNRFTTGRQEFADHYLVSRNRALDAVLQSVKAGRKADLDSIIHRAELPPEALDAYRTLLEALTGHYRELLQAEGTDYKSLVRSAYRSRTDFLLFCNQLNRAEKQLNAALKPHMAKETAAFDETVRGIEQTSEELRRQEADEIFS